MNAFADWLFSVMFGWMGTAANSAWNAVVNATSGTGSFFSRYWLCIVLLIIIGGTVLDYAVWLVRWRPYLVWRSWLTRRRRTRHLQRTAQDLEHTDMDDQTLNTIADWVSTPQDAYPLDGLYPEPSPIPYANAPQAAGYIPTEFIDPNSAPAVPYNQQIASYPPSYPQPADHGWQPSAQNAYQPAPLWPPAAPVQYMPPEPDTMPQAAPPQTLYPEAFKTDSFSPAEEVSNPWGNDFSQPEDFSPSPASASRRRRSEKNRRLRSAQRLFSGLKEHLQNEDQESMIDGLPAPVRQEDAFHDPVYPSTYRYQQPDYNSINNQNGQPQ